MRADSVSFLRKKMASVNPPKLYQIRGAQYCRTNGLTTFRVYAPNARNVWVILTVFGREELGLPMQKSGVDLWECVTSKAPPGRTYLYLIDDYNGKRMFRTDPFSFSTIDISEVRQIQSIVYDPTRYQWGDEQWINQRIRTNPLQSPLSIYEMQPKSWKSGIYRPVNYRQIVPDLIAYCLKMNFTHVEIYGLMEHSNRSERGYQITNYFAPYHDNGQCDDLKYFIDQLHQHNIGVILDWIPTHYHHYHFNQSYSVSLHEYDGTNLHGSNASRWGTIYFDFDKEESYRLLFASAIYFVDQIHVDGIRFDAVSQMIRRNWKDIPSAIRFLRHLNETIHRDYPGVLLIAEETENYPNLCQTMNFDVKWNIHWSNDSMNLLRTPYHQRQDHWQEKVVNHLYSSQTNSDKTILIVSHDSTDCHWYDPRLSLYHCVQHATDELTKFSDLRNYFAWQFLSPSRGYLIHMGEELAQPISWFYRFRQGQTSVDWSLADPQTLNGKIQEYIADLNLLYRHHPHFWRRGEFDFSMVYEFQQNLIVAYHRGIYDQRRMLIIHNFSNRGYSKYDITLPTSDPNVVKIQKINELFNSNNPIYGGSGLFGNEQIQLLQRYGHEKFIRLAIPPLTTLVLEEHLSP